ncbi:putative U3 small nucleolar RNA-associated protein 18 [Cyphellophora attinorum]|uniref:Putative U3 small nucleolar RNA-associated protein 18 n=1 Tax=Cyphellophora attinorum TaxID=1664694 RepID=A0A0N1H948_9EURO|nr:putative U3 small nucleolar RNA-associated protein 18 [Phialophora attinorum]KPI39947.1 putative U3 small nucleolar RNA-associated protein 18 [Phialophora attinorum]
MASGHPTRRRSRRRHADVDVLEKDDTELRLENALFGDEAGFLDSISAAKYNEGKELQTYGGDSEDDVVSDDDEDLAEVPDEDLFFLDAGTGAAPPTELDIDAKPVAESEQKRPRAVWYDSDDDRLTVSLASDTRLRKLRDTEADDVISGREYISRLRRQYERLHPRPEWLDYARKRRKTSHGAASDSESDISMDGDSDTPTTKPLAEILRSLTPLTRSSNTINGSRKRRKLRPEVIDIQRTKDVTPSGPSSIDTLQFHPHYPLLLAAGPSQTITLYHISPEPPHPNPILTSLHVRGMPVHTAAFNTPLSTTSNTDITDATQIYLSSRRRYFHTWSLSSGTITKITRPLTTIKHDQRTTEHFKLSPCRRYMGLVSSSRKAGGSINVLCTTTHQLLAQCRIDAQGGVSDFDWWRNGEGFAVVGKNGEVSEFSMSEKRTIARWHDEGAVGTTVLSIGGEDSRWIAIGSSSGIVNIYDRKASSFLKILQSSTSNTQGSADANTDSTQLTYRPTPTKTLSQLTTPISSLTFSPDGQLLVMASRWKKNALRLVHLPSCTVYRNWPTDKTALGRVASVALGGIEAGGGGGGQGREWLAVGNEQGAVRLWEVRG